MGFSSTTHQRDIGALVLKNSIVALEVRKKLTTL